MARSLSGDKLYPMKLALRWLAIALSSLIALIAVALLVIALATPRLPPINAVADYQPKMPLRVLTSDGILIGEFGEERRSLVRLPEVPKHLVQAILAAEDDAFFQHRGIDFTGIARAVLANIFAKILAKTARAIPVKSIPRC